MKVQERYNEYVQKMHKIADVKYALAVLQWDQETYLPPKGADFRAQQMATLSEIAHTLFAEDHLGKLLEELTVTDGLDPDQRRNAEHTLEDYRKNKKYSPQFVRELSECTSRSYFAWIEARKKNDFSVFKKSLQDLINLKRKESDILDYDQHPYDAHLNEYEKGASVEWLDAMFKELEPPLRQILADVSGKPQPEDHFLFQHFDKDAQWHLGLDLLKQVGFDFDAGRQDISEHPFTTNFSPLDVRVTTRIDENDFTSMAWSCLHEGGHAMYEQGLPVRQYGLPLGEYCSVAIHESQSRLWENCIGRSLPFLEHNMPLFKKYFPQLNSLTSHQLFAGVNRVKPSLIRTEADELTYHFHIMIRYRLEKKLIEGTLNAEEIPGFWNESYRSLLGVEIPDDKRGCLQDIHWSHGSFGYFPTYSLGSLYAAQFFAAMKKQHDQLEHQISNGDYLFVHQWLRDNVYQYGKTFTGSDLCNKITGEPLQLRYFTQYLTDKYKMIYGLSK